MSCVALAWNDLGMHCLNPTCDKAVILPPYNTVWVQVIERGDPPQVVTAGLIGDCRVCHSTSVGGGINDLSEAHGGSRAP